MLTKDKFLTEEEVNYLLKLCRKYPGRDSLLLMMVLFTGGRGAEVLNIKKCHLDNGCVMIYGLKGSNDRNIPLPPDYYKEITSYVSDMEDDDRVFPISVRMLRTIWSRWRLNPNKGVHSLRHAFGVRSYSKSRDIHLVSTMLGHRSIINTQKYLAFVESEEKMKEVLSQMWS